ncbi:type II toxin-antitoxin system RelE/ParE family toxin [Oricola sp.]|uniref:type II toxin-antitoxin system RelE/ParE family toxin n=1 Tax=Oricola sp. TaxID=1979950 RepID=UPI0025FA44D8|nr:type II toxin-antitoxin system RelE/ParE family toxin [Oricola sp.]MCI5077176.1 type II toxin-antitoxin system RelE/ParE family toxin [Oricola sp.]
MRIVWTRSALRQLDGILAYIADRNPVAAARVATEISERISLLADRPDIGRHGRVDDTREYVLAPLPYVVAYRVTDQVEILAVMHGAQLWPTDF